MELPIIRRLPLPEECLRLVEKFVHEPHPTAILIDKLYFRRSIFDFFGLCTPRPTLKMIGEDIRIINEHYFPPRYMPWSLEKHPPVFSFDEHSGECLFRKNTLTRVCKARPWTPEPFFPQREYLKD